MLVFSEIVYYSFTFYWYYENGYKIILHFVFSENIHSCIFTLYLQKTVTNFCYESAYYNRLHLVTMQITMKAYFHCIGIMLVICQDVSAYYICYIAIYPSYYESLFSLYWHIVRNMSSRMNFLKVSCKGSAK